MSFHKFPFDANEAKTEVTLPVGTHVLQLVVTDEAGSVSLPDTVTITVKKQEKPHLSHIDPATGQRGREIEAIIFGHHLQEVTAIKVFRGDEEDHRVSVTIRPGATAEQVPVLIRIFEHAALGPRTIEVTTTHGSATVKFGVTTAAEPRIIEVAPVSAPLGMLRDIPVRIEGDHLETAQEVAFLLAGQKDHAIQAQIRRASAEFLDVDVAISTEAALGSRSLTVTTPAGTAVSPPGSGFQVVPGPVQIGIITLALVTAVIHFALNFPSMLFILNGLGYLALLIALYWPARLLWGHRFQLRWGLIVYTAITILAWLVLGDKHLALGYITKAVELALIGLLLVEGYQSRRKVTK